MMGISNKKAREFLRSSWLSISKIQVVAIFAGALVLFSQLGWLNPLVNNATAILLDLRQIFSSRVDLSMGTLVIAIFWLFFISKKVFDQAADISVVAGSFNENFKNGLENWDFGRSNWKIIQDEGESVLSISGHESEGLVRKGFNWIDYEFSFETKIIKKASGWIVRAADRNRFFMLQIYMNDTDSNDSKFNAPVLRPHYREPYNQMGAMWIALDHDSLPLSKTKLAELRLLEWIKVKILVIGENMNVYINGIHVFKYDLYKTELANVSGGQVGHGLLGKLSSTSTNSSSIMVGGYRFGSVGFREASDEEAMFRNIKVKPIK